MLARALLRSTAQLPSSHFQVRAARSAIVTASKIAIPAGSPVWVRRKGNYSKQNHQQQQQQQQNQRRNDVGQQKSIKSHEGKAAANSSGLSSSELRPNATPDANSSQTPPEASNETPQEQQPQPPFNLPDLTQGIPSTLQYEREGATNKTALQALDELHEEHHASSGSGSGAGGGGGGGGGKGKHELPASAYMTSGEKRREQMAKYAFVAAIVSGVGGVAYLGREWDEFESKIHADAPNGWSPKAWWNRARSRLSDTLSYYQEPAFEKLLPDPDPMFERPYTLCISLEDLLVRSEWSREHGWRVAKRPGVDYFLRYLSQYYELVLFTSVPWSLGDPLVRKLDPYRFIVWPLFREATKYKDGEVVKDLSYLNRDLSKVIMIDTNPAHVRNQPENAIVIPKWTGDPKDTGLVSLVPFLEYIHIMQYKDVRDVIRSFEGKCIPAEFARREAIARSEWEKNQVAQRRQPGGKSGIAGLGAMFGLQPNKMTLMAPAEDGPSASEAYAQGKMIQDVARERGRKNYEAMEDEIRKNGEKWLKEEQVMMEKMQAEAMGAMKSSLTGWMPWSSSPPAQENATPQTEQK